MDKLAEGNAACLTRGRRARARSCCGLLHVRKLPGLGAAARTAPGASTLLLRHHRTRLAIEELAVDPDAEAAEAAAAGARPAAAALCGGGPPAAGGALDF